MNIRIGIFLLIALVLSPAFAQASAGCAGKVTRLWVENDDTLYFYLQPINECVCNFVEGGSKGFKVPTTQANREEQYTALLAAYMADKEVSSWFDWDGADGTKPCHSWSISLFK